MKNLFLFYLSFIFVLKVSSQIDHSSSPSLDITFTENKGQVGDQNFKQRPDVLFYGSKGNMMFHLKQTGISYQFFRHDGWKEKETKGMETIMVPTLTTVYRLDINWLHTNSEASMISTSELPGHSNYYGAVTPQGVTGVRSFKEITYSNLYSGIDLHYYVNEGNLKYDFIVSAGSDYKQIELEVNGAENISTDKEGALLIKTPLGTFQEAAPLVYQQGKELKARWIIKGNILSFEIDNYDPSHLLIIDPLVRSWGTWYGGTGIDYVFSCATDGNGNSYITGETASTSGAVIATTGAHQQSVVSGWTGPFLAKFNSNGVRQWGTYYGNGASESAYACAVNDQGEVYMTGYTASVTGSVIATPGSHQPALGGGSYYWTDAFLVKFNSSGARLWGTFYGGTSDEHGYGVALDPTGNVYICGDAKSTTSVSSVGSQQPNYGGGNTNGGDGFLAKFNSSGVRQWGTYYGGSGEDWAQGICADAAGNVFVAGTTASYNSANIASAAAHQTNYVGGGFYAPWDAFLAKFNTNGVRQWGTYYGGAGYEQGKACSVDNSGNVYMAGFTTSSVGVAIATPASHESTFGNGSVAAFLVKFNSTGTRQWGTYYGSSGGASGYACAVNDAGDIYLGGETSATGGNIISTPGSHQVPFGLQGDGFLALFSASGLRKEGTYYGGTGSQLIMSCATNSLGQVYAAGYSSASPGTGVATPGSQQPNYGGAMDGFLVQFKECSTPPANPQDSTDHSLAICESNFAILKVSSGGTVNWYDSPTSTIVIATGTTYTTPPLAGGPYAWYVTAKTCNITSSPPLEILIDVGICTTLNEQQSDRQNTKAFPNPNSGKFEIEAADDVNLIVCNVLGVVVREIKLSSENERRCAVTDLEKGIYFITDKNNSGKINLKVVVQ